MTKAQTIKRNVTIGQRRTSILLDKIVWQSIDMILEWEQVGLSFLCFEIDKRRQKLSFAQSLRLFTVIYFRHLADSKLQDEEKDAAAIPLLADDEAEKYPQANLLIDSLHVFVQAAGHAQAPDHA